jgi:hypothetical protein
MVIHKCGQDSHRHAAAYRRQLAGSALDTTNRSQLASRPICRPRFVVWRRFGLKRHCPKLTVFLPHGQPFCNIREALQNIAQRTGGGCDVSEKSAPDRSPLRPGLTGRTPVSTLIQSPESRRYGCDPSTKRGGCAGYQARHKAYRGIVWASVTHRHGEPGRTRCQMQQGESRGKGQADVPAE